MKDWQLVYQCCCCLFFDEDGFKVLCCEFILFILFGILVGHKVFDVCPHFIYWCFAFLFTNCWFEFSGSYEIEKGHVFPFA
jgi:hypothetical protein